MKSLYLFGFSLIAICCLCISCDDKTEEFDQDFGYEYYPIEKDAYWIYQVDSIVYSLGGNNRDSSQSYIREEIVETFIDQLGDTIYRIERKYNKELTGDWLVLDEWASHVAPNKVTRTEENLKYVKMVFPANVNKSWDGNSFVDLNTEILIGGEMLKMFLDWDYRILSVDQAEEIGGFNYEQVLSVQNADSDPIDLLHKRYVIEKFAKNIGLVYKKHMILDTQCIEDCEGQTWEEKAEGGYIMEMTLVEYGK